MHADPMLRSGHIFTFPVSTLSPKLLHNCLGALVLFWRHQRLESCEVAFTCVTEFGDWEAGQAGLEVESRHLAVLNVALLTVTRSYCGSRARRWTDRYKNSAAILLRLQLHHSRDLVLHARLKATTARLLHDHYRALQLAVRQTPDPLQVCHGKIRSEGETILGGPNQT